jgi:outer membrane receptor protein involved in Fe transport
MRVLGALASALPEQPGAQRQSIQIYAGPDLPAIWYHDLNLTYRFKAAGRDLQAYLIVTNLFNQQPRISPSTTFAGIPGFGSPYVLGDDPVGRYYTVGMRMKY